MLLLQQSFHVCPLATQHRNMCPITERERIEETNPSLCTELKWKHTIDASLLFKLQCTEVHIFPASFCHSTFSLVTLFHFDSLCLWSPIRLQTAWVTSSASPCPVKPLHQIYCYNFTRSVCVRDSVWMCVREIEQQWEKKSVCVLIYDAVLVINMVLLSHLDVVIDTWSGQHMGWELEL